jgi:hypothetical protein
MPEGYIHTIPIKLDDCEVPRRFSRHQWVNLNDEGAFDRIVGALHQGLRQRGVPIPTPPAKLNTAIALSGGDFTPRRVNIQQYFRAEPRPNAAINRNRRDMIEKVWTIWITDVLQHSLPYDILLELGLTERSAMVTRALDLYVQRPDLADHIQAPSTRLIDIFDRLDHALLILGAPGAGKTTLLLTLAQDLLIRAAQDPEHPIPVVFPLSSWAQQRRPLADWLVKALQELYDVPHKIGQPWVDQDQILPLLDGLDEVASEHRDACVEAINTFRQDHGLLPLVVCSRAADYEGLSQRLRLQGAIVVQPLACAGGGLPGADRRASGRGAQGFARGPDALGATGDADDAQHCGPDLRGTRGERAPS